MNYVPHLMETPTITFDQALAGFRNQADMARFFNVTRESVSAWKDKGRLPPLRAMQLERVRPELFKAANHQDQEAA